MVDRKFMAIAVGAIFVLGMYGPNIAEIFQSAEAHGVQAQLQSRFIKIEDEAITRQSLSTGETLTLSGKLAEPAIWPYGLGIAAVIAIGIITSAIRKKRKSV